MPDIFADGRILVSLAGIEYAEMARVHRLQRLVI